MNEELECKVFLTLGNHLMFLRIENPQLLPEDIMNDILANSCWEIGRLAEGVSTFILDSTPAFLNLFFALEDVADTDMKVMSVDYDREI